MMDELHLAMFPLARCPSIRVLRDRFVCSPFLQYGEDLSVPDPPHVRHISRVSPLSRLAST